MTIDWNPGGVVRLWFAAYGHPDGPSAAPVMHHDACGRVYEAHSPPPHHMFEVIGEDVYPRGRREPAFVIRERFVYTAEQHPFGAEAEPWFEIRDAYEPS